MDELSREALEAEGFTGFLTFETLRSTGYGTVPVDAGLYAVLRPSVEPPLFLERSPGGRFKRRDPTVPVRQLEARWVEGCPIVYVGKATSLRTRVKAYGDFGAGRPVGHWGGRFIWQLGDSADLVVAWRRAAAGETAPGAEAALLRRFKKRYGCLPFANIADPSRGVV
jgi:hypothetical protein